MWASAGRSEDDELQETSDEWRMMACILAADWGMRNTHSPILMSYPNAWIYYLDKDDIRRIEYEETEHYQVTRDFLNNHEMMLNVMMTD